MTGRNVYIKLVKIMLQNLQTSVYPELLLTDNHKI